MSEFLSVLVDFDNNIIGLGGAYYDQIMDGIKKI